MSSIASNYSLLVIEQPAKQHRFRYQNELKANRMGSILHGRCNSSKVAVSVTLREPAGPAGCQLKLVATTVFDDLEPHPYYLSGENCFDGVFAKQLTFLPGECPPVQQVKLDHIVVICVNKRQNKRKANADDGKILDGNYEQKVSKWNFFKKAAKQNPLKTAHVDELRLAFQLFEPAHDGSDEWVEANCDPVYTEIICDAKTHSEMRVDYLIPKTVVSPTQNVWLYMKNPLPELNASRFKISLRELSDTHEYPGMNAMAELIPAKSVKKQLVVFNVATLSNRSVAVSVIDTVTEESSDLVELQLEPPIKRIKRQWTEVDQIVKELLGINPDPSMQESSAIYSQAPLQHTSTAQPVSTAQQPNLAVFGTGVPFLQIT